MTGGRSRSSADTTTTTQTVPNSASGVVGDVVQGQTVTINQELPDTAVNVFEQLINLAGQSLNLTREAGQSAIDAASQASQPDVALVQGYQKQVYYAIGAVAIIAAVMLFKK